MPRILIVGLSLVAGLLIKPSAHSQDKKTWAPIQITWHGQSFFEIKSSKGTNIITDPHQIMEYGRIEGLKAVIVLISHLHNDHTQIGVIENIKDKNVKTIVGLKGGGNRTSWNLVDEKIKDVHIRSVGAYHDDVEGMRYGKNTIFVMEMDGWRVAFLGDLGHLLTPDQLKKIGPVDVLMIPVGGIYTLNGSEAKKVAEQLKPKEYIFPMHRGTKIYDGLLPATEFADGWPRENVAVSDDNVITLNRDAQRPRPLIVDLHYWPKARKK
jgi:L-ascorbate metabolism protein UlaG (beta-lactamase superfamily)